MKTTRLFLATGMLLVLIVAPAWGSENGPALPAVLASLDQANVTAMDDRAIAEVRGEAPEYVMVKYWPYNFFDLEFNPNVSFALNDPFAFRYGNYGGPGHGDDSGLTVPVDGEDHFFRLHDSIYNPAPGADNTAANEALLYNLIELLPESPSLFWGSIYQPYKADYDEYDDYDLELRHCFYQIYVYRLSIHSAGRTSFFFSWLPMPISEYARRQAIVAFSPTALP